MHKQTVRSNKVPSKNSRNAGMRGRTSERGKGPPVLHEHEAGSAKLRAKTKE